MKSLLVKIASVCAEQDYDKLIDQLLPGVNELTEAQWVSLTIFGESLRDALNTYAGQKAQTTGADVLRDAP